MTIIIATGNRNKFEEIRRILADLGVEAVMAAEAGIYYEAEETGSTFEENALLKALAVSSASGQPCVADDSGLEVDALGGAPGIFSARYAGPTDKSRVDKLLGELEGVPAERRGARFVCAICCVFPDGRSFTVRGECAGSIAFEESGSGGFGYDPVFIEKTTGLTFASLDSAAKDALSHRGKALAAFNRKLAEFIAQEPGSRAD